MHIGNSSKEYISLIGSSVFIFLSSVSFPDEESCLRCSISKYFNSPFEVGDAMIDAGFNLVSLATNHTMDRGESALYQNILIHLLKFQ